MRLWLPFMILLQIVIWAYVRFSELIPPMCLFPAPSRLTLIVICCSFFLDHCSLLFICYSRRLAYSSISFQELDNCAAFVSDSSIRHSFNPWESLELDKLNNSYVFIISWFFFIIRVLLQSSSSPSFSNGFALSFVSAFGLCVAREDAFEISRSRKSENSNLCEAPLASKWVP